MAAPEAFPDYATSTNYDTGPDTGTPTKELMMSGDIANGAIRGIPPAPKKWNYWANLVGRWIRYLEGATVAQYTPSASSLALNGTLTLTEAFNFGGFTLAGNGVQVPDPGVYRLTGHLLIQSSSTSDPASGLIHTRVGTVGDAGAAEAGRLVGRRYSATPTDEFVVSGSFLYEITDPENELIWLRNVVAATITTPSSGSLVDSFIIERIGRVP